MRLGPSSSSGCILEVIDMFDYWGFIVTLLNMDLIGWFPLVASVSDTVKCQQGITYMASPALKMANKRLKEQGWCLRGMQCFKVSPLEAPQAWRR